MWKRRIRVLALSVLIIPTRPLLSGEERKCSSWLLNGLHKTWKDLCKFLSVQKYVLTRVNGIFKWVFLFIHFFLLRCGNDGKNKYTRHTRNGLLYQQFFLIEWLLGLRALDIIFSPTYISDTSENKNLRTVPLSKYYRITRNWRKL